MKFTQKQNSDRQHPQIPQLNSFYDTSHPTTILLRKHKEIGIERMRGGKLLGYLKCIRSTLEYVEKTERFDF